MKTRIWLALLIIYVVWGSTYLGIHYAIATIPPFVMATARFVIAGSLLYGWRRLAKDPPPRGEEWRAAIIVGLLLLLGGNGGVTWAETRVPSGVAALLIATVPLWVVIIDTLRPGGQRPNGMTLAGVLLGFVGMALLIGGRDLVGTQPRLDPLGTLALLISALLWALGSVYSRGARLPGSPLLGTSMEMLAGAGGLALAATLTGEWQQVNLAEISATSWWGLIYLIVMGSLVGFSAYTWLLRVAPTSLASTYAYVNPMIAIFLGNLLAKEPLTPRILLAALVIVSSVAVINMSRSTPRPAVGPAVQAPAGND